MAYLFKLNLDNARDVLLPGPKELEIINKLQRDFNEKGKKYEDFINKVSKFFKTQGVDMPEDRKRLKNMFFFWDMAKRLSCKFILKFFEDHDLVIN